MNTVCLSLVSSRNLTTLLGSCLMLHPNMQILNHWPQINQNIKTNFLVDYKQDKLDNFIKEVLRINEEGIRVFRKGGIITKSHAFKEDIERIFNQRYGSTDKKNIKSIFWKDSDIQKL